MSEFKVADICIGKIDSTGVMIDRVYSKIDPLYAVYRSAQGVMVHFADESKLCMAQQTTLAAINPVRHEINGLIDGWRASGAPDKQAQAGLFDRRIAYALVIALQGFGPQAEDLLQATKRDLVEERSARARIEHLLIATVAALLLIGLVATVTATWFRGIHGFGADARSLWTAAAIGALGALFSIAISIRGRTVVPDPQAWDNIADAALRIVIGAIAAAVLVALLATNAVQLTLAGTAVATGAGASWLVNFVIAFIGGFSERLVPAFLETAALAPIPSASARPVAAAGVVPAGGGAPAAGQVSADGVAPVAGAGAPVPADQPQPEDDVDGCTEHLGPSDDELTHDIELPAASGGVEEPRRD